MFFLKHGVLYD